MGRLPSGTITFLFTDIEGSTRRLEQLGEQPYAEALAEHRQALREAFRRHGGVEVDTQGDSFFVAFETAAAALAAAREIAAGPGRGPLAVRVGLHTGTPLLTAEGYVGVDVHRAARICAVGHGGQVLVSAATAALAGLDGLRDLGEHRLRDLSRPERLYQANEGEFPPPRSLYATNLPVPPTSFVGRDTELAEVLTLLAQDDVRLLTLTGAGGTGKSRLAQQAAGEVADAYPDGVWWIPLAALREPALVVDTAARTLGARVGLAEHIGARRMLLLFDNFEQVIDAAPDLAVLLGACPNLRLLVTSRETLRAAGERQYHVPPLAPADGVELFIARARATRRDFEASGAVAGVVAEICNRLDNLPLAIELAAAWVAVLPPATILERLAERFGLLTGGPRDAPERQRTLREAIGWSYDLLAPAEQSVFARLAVFRGGFRAEDAEHVAGATLGILRGLVDKSLLRRQGERLMMLQTIRAYAIERLAASPEADDVYRRHAHHFLGLVEEAEPHLFQFSQRWFELLAAEHDNLRAALDRLEAASEAQDALRLAGALQRFWIVRGHLSEAGRRYERLLSADDRPTAARAKSLNGAALVAINIGNPRAAQRYAEEALDIYRPLADEWGVARSLFALGYAYADEHRLGVARELLEESRQGFARLGDAHNMIFVTANLSWVCRELGDRDYARSLDEDNLARARQLGNRSVEALALGGLALDAAERGEPAAALSMLRDALRIDRELGDVRRTVDELCRFARALAVAGRSEDAVRLLAGAGRLHAEIGAGVSAVIAHLNEGTLAMLRAQLDEESLARTAEQAREMTFDEAFALALGE